MALQLLVKFGAPIIFPEAVPVGVMADPAVGLVIIVWWAFFSRAPRFERWAETLEEELLARAGDLPALSAASAGMESAAEFTDDCSHTSGDITAPRRDTSSS